MAVMLPGYLVEALNICGFNWPSTNEDDLRSWANDLRALASTMPGAKSEVTTSVAGLAQHNQGPAASGFKEYMERDGSPVKTFDDVANLSNAIAGGADTAAVIIEGLKWLVVGELIAVAAAIAGAIVTAGIGSLAVPAAKKAAEIAVELAIEKIIGDLLMGDPM